MSRKITLIAIIAALFSSIFFPAFTSTSATKEELTFMLGEKNTFLYSVYLEDGEKRASLAISDSDNDGIVDFVRLSEYRQYRHNPAFDLRAEEVDLYRGGGKLRRMVKDYGSHLENLKGKKIPEDESGVSFYTGYKDGFLFRPVMDKRISAIFALADRLFAVRQKNAPFIFSPFSQELTALFKKGIAQFPQEWWREGEREKFLKIPPEK